MEHDKGMRLAILALPLALLAGCSGDDDATSKAAYRKHMAQTYSMDAAAAAGLMRTACGIDTVPQARRMLQQAEARGGVSVESLEAAVSLGVPAYCPARSDVWTKAFFD